ncbi:DUF4142 domain-containing protein [Noviherbaspirillum sp. 17J57-3]|uniref:DUF4142 domain-containing protein n=2 Tax=Noviherbaspirillum galbum TaxID=2709383 RepID=A0A6B3ST11_9BURK|nr:DUF4142 domain-containing protein [Noviherbaspirillum galbum]
MRDLAYANISEIEAAKLAQSKSSNDQVKQFAQKMIDDHTKASQDLQALADAKGVKLPTTPDTKHKAAVKMMSALSAEKFDQKYLAQGGLRDHKNTHQLLARIESRASDPDLKALATKTMPVVDQHLQLAQDVTSGKSTGSMSGSSGSTSGSSASGTGGTTGKTPAVGAGPSDTSGNSATSGSAAASRAPSTGTGDKPGTATDTGTNTTGTGSSSSTSK